MQIEPTWWITAVEAPIVAAMFYMIHGLRRDLHERIDRSDQRDTAISARTREDLADFKLEVARTYVPLSLIRDLDRRVSSQLLRIEEKLEAATAGPAALALAHGLGMPRAAPRGRGGILAARGHEEDGP
jgi:hypothetical protein